MIQRYEERDGHMWLVTIWDSYGMHRTEQDLGEIYNEEKEIKPKRKRRK